MSVNLLAVLMVAEIPVIGSVVWLVTRRRR
jgi:hypothetical protein